MCVLLTFNVIYGKINKKTYGEKYGHSSAFE